MQLRICNQSLNGAVQNSGRKVATVVNGSVSTEPATQSWRLLWPASEPALVLLMTSCGWLPPCYQLLDWLPWKL